MNGSTEKRKPPIVLHGVGLEAGASTCRRRAGRRKRRDAAVAAHWRMRPAVREPANPFSACRETWIDSSHAPGNGNARAINSHGQDEHPLNNAVRMHARHRVKTDTVRVHARPAPRASTVLNLIVFVDPQVELCVRQPNRRVAFVLFPQHSCRTLAIVVRSSALRSVVSLRED
jgi:hypothetical protein